MVTIATTDAGALPQLTTRGAAAADESSDGTASDEVAGAARRRRTVAVISHPDAGKSTLTEALLLHARRIDQAGVTHGKRGRRATVSDWMAVEQARGISVSSAAVQFDVDGVLVTVVDTPGHADFSEDTYRVLAAVDAVIMLIDAAKGMEAQTSKLFEVCRRQQLPVLTMINKWDRPGMDALGLIEEIEQATGMVPTPLTWPIGIAGRFLGLLDVVTGAATTVRGIAAGVELAEERPWVRERLSEPEYLDAVENAALLDIAGHRHDQELFLAGATTPVVFGAAVLNIGVRRLLEAVVELAPAPAARRDAVGRPHDVANPFSGFVFKVQSGMNAAHHDRVAYVRICSGRFERGMALVHQRTGRRFSTKYAQQVFGQDRATVEEGWPGDVVGLVNAMALRPGDTVHAVGAAVEFPGIPRFTPELFRLATPEDSSRHKQFHRGLTHLNDEGIIQLLNTDRRGPQQPILAAVGTLQFDVLQERMAREFGCPVQLAGLPYTLAIPAPDTAAEVLAGETAVEVAHRSDGAVFVLAHDRWSATALARRHPGLDLTIP